jgi:phage host-nuclease inhibitor protein Gam
VKESSGKANLQKQLEAECQHLKKKLEDYIRHVEDVSRERDSLKEEKADALKEIQDTWKRHDVEMHHLQVI